MTKEYLLLYSDEDGGNAIFLDDAELQEMLSNPRGYASIKDFYLQLPSMHLSEYDEGHAVLLKVELLKPRSKTLAWRIDD